jgi:hypothetical protein
MRLGFIGLLAGLLCVLASTGEAQSALDTCVNVSSTRGDAAAITRLVRAELDRHATHRASEAPCAQQLDVELIAIASELYLTGRMSGQVPDRLRVEGGRLDLAVTELLRIVLGNDPLVLRDPKRGDWFSRALHGLRRRAHPLWGAEVGQRWVFAGGTPRSLPVLSLHYRREVDQWQLGLRLDVAVWLNGRIEALHPVWMASLLPELAWFTSRTGHTAGFLAIGVGVSHQRFEGPRADEPGVRGQVASTGLLFAPRIGVELFRTTNTRLSLFVEADLPAFSADDSNKGVVRAFTPSLTVGAGASF